MKLKKLVVRKKSVSPGSDTLEDFNDDDICSFDEKQGSPVQRNTANARERARMRVLSSAFYRLKAIIPWVPHDTKLSKLDTLRLARNYITHLSSVLDGKPANEITNKLPYTQKMFTRNDRGVDEGHSKGDNEGLGGMSYPHYQSATTWPYIFQQVPELNTNKVSISSSKEIIKKSQDYTHLTTSSDSLHKFTPYDDESNIRSVTQFTMYNDSRCHDDFEMSYD